MAYRSTSLPFNSILLHDAIQILPSVELLPTRIDEIVDVVSQRDKRFTTSSRFDCENGSDLSNRKHIP
jgi:hypothetical protein